MSIVSILVFVSQAARRLAIKAKNKAVTAVSNRIEKVEAEQVKLEGHRSKLMVACHDKHYARKGELTTEYNIALAKLQAKFDKDMGAEDKAFKENKAVIALTSQAASNQLKAELVALRSELDHLTK